MSDQDQEKKAQPQRRRAPIGPTLPPHLQLGKKPSMADRKDDGPRRSRSRSPDSGGRETWMTELPESKLRADPLSLKNRQFITKKYDSGLAPTKEKTVDDEEEDRRQEEYIRDYNREHRPESLAEIYKREHRGERRETEAKDRDERKFDWDRDMNQGIKAGSSKNTSELLNRLGSFNNRFASGSSKKFL